MALLWLMPDQTKAVISVMFDEQELEPGSVEKEILADWGISNFRAYQFDESGLVAREH